MLEDRRFADEVLDCEVKSMDTQYSGRRWITVKYDGSETSISDYFVL
jgi:hypothetical protein